MIWGKRQNESSEKCNRNEIPFPLCPLAMLGLLRDGRSTIPYGDDVDGESKPVLSLSKHPRPRTVNAKC